MGFFRNLSFANKCVFSRKNAFLCEKRVFLLKMNLKTKKKNRLGGSKALIPLDKEKKNGVVMERYRDWI